MGRTVGRIAASPSKDLIMSKLKEPQTVAAVNGIATDDAFGAVVPPIYLSSRFAFVGFEQARAYDYTRTANPSRDVLADTLAKLEGGAGAVVVSSGMAAVDLVLGQLKLHDMTTFARNGWEDLPSININRPSSVISWDH